MEYKDFVEGEYVFMLKSNFDSEIGNIYKIIKFGDLPKEKKKDYDEYYDDDLGFLCVENCFFGEDFSEYYRIIHLCPALKILKDL